MVWANKEGVIGNLYSIENPYDVQAKMFFAQGCEVEVQEEEDE